MIDILHSNSIDITDRTLAAQRVEQVLTNVSPAFRFGYEDARRHEPFCPEAYFVSGHMQSSYCLGFLTAQPGNLIACAWWTQWMEQDELEERIAREHGDFVRSLGH